MLLNIGAIPKLITYRILSVPIVISLAILLSGNMYERGMTCLYLNYMSIHYKHFLEPNNFSFQFIRVIYYHFKNRLLWLFQRNGILIYFHQQILQFSKHLNDTIIQKSYINMKIQSLFQ